MDSPPPSNERLGLYGGSFDPVHLGHLEVARRALEAAHLDRVLFMPAAQPPHKPGRSLAPAADRVAMLELALAREDRMEVSTLELERGGTSYTLDTVHALQRPRRELWLLLGSDNLPGLPGWRGVEELLSLARPLVVARREGDEALLEEACARLSPATSQRLREGWVRIEPHPAASTAVRADLARGQRPDGLDPAVEEFLRRRGLYLSGAGE